MALKDAIPCKHGSENCVEFREMQIVRHAKYVVKGMYPAPHIHEHFTIHKWLRQTAYILTHNLNMLEHIANNGMNTTTHTDANIAQF